MKLQNTIRSTYYHLPVFCGFCGHQVLEAEDSSSGDVSPCKHTLYVSTGEGFEYISDRVKNQLTEKGYIFDDDDEFMSNIAHKTDEDQDLSPYELSEHLEFDDGIQIELVVGPPSGMVCYVGFAPLDGE